MSRAWNKFRELKPVLCAKGIRLNVKGKVYVTCVRSCMMYGGETSALPAETERKLAELYCYHMRPQVVDRGQASSHRGWLRNKGASMHHEEAVANKKQPRCLARYWFIKG